MAPASSTNSRHAMPTPRPGTVVAACALLLALASSAWAQTPKLLLQLNAGQPFEQFGWSVETADLDDDGFGDVVVGAPRAFLPLRLDAGRAEVHFGAAQLDTVFDLLLRGTHSFANIGIGFDTGDVGGDGIPDMTVFSNALPPGPPRANVHFGGESFGLTIRTSIALQVDPVCSEGVLRSTHVGDFNGDGYDDIAAAAGCRATAGIFYGGPTSDGLPDFTRTLTETFTEIRPRAVGDVNADGFADVFFSAPAGTLEAVPSRLYLGAANAGSVTEITFADGSSAGGSDGLGLGDFDDDGYDDLLIASLDGTARVYLGGPSFDTSADIVFAGQPSFGLSAHAADVNGDDVPDLIAATHERSRVQVFFGGASVDTTADLTLDGPLGDPNEWFGHAVSAVDMDGDDRLELVVGAPTAFAGSILGGGRTYIYSYFAVKLVDAPTGQTWFSGTQQTVRWTSDEAVDVSLSTDGGTSWTTLASNLPASAESLQITVPDVRTPVARVRVHAHGTTPNRSTGQQSGDLRIVPRAAEWSVAVARGPTLTGSDDTAREGSSLAFAGDFDADGMPELVTGAPAHSGGAGQARVVSRAADGSFDVRVLEGEGGGFGTSVAGLADVTGDGHPDVIVGAPTAGPDGAGRVYVFAGGPAASSTPIVVLDGEAPGDGFGQVVSSPGDVDGDGFDDVMVLAAGRTGSDASRGRAYVFHTATLSPSPDIVIDPGAGRRLLALAGERGDMNFDGHADIAYTVGPASTDASGAVRVHYGGATLSAAHDLSLPAAAPGEDFGAALVWAGDLDLDGVSDLAVGAPSYSGTSVQLGRVYVYSGGPTPQTEPSLFYEGSVAGGQFGRSLAALGDVNADGHGDVGVGADDDGGRLRGRVRRVRRRRCGTRRHAAQPGCPRVRLRHVSCGRCRR